LVYPAARFSTRVPFGTGPAMINFCRGNFQSYPYYHDSLFDTIKETYDIIPELFAKDVDTEFIDFLKKQYKTNDLWSSLRKNFKTLPQFTRAFHEKADGLRILQFLKAKYTPHTEKRAPLTNLPVTELNTIRDSLFETEMDLRKVNSNNTTQ
jgi:hypothetical protein